MKRLVIIIILLWPALTQAQPGDLVTEMTRDHVDISINYTGDEITLFGALSRPGEIVIKVKSPDEDVALERKGRTGPFWLSQGKHQIKQAPGLYYLLSSKPVDPLLPEKERIAHGLDLVDALMDMQISPSVSQQELPEIRTAILRLKQQQQRYVVNPEAVDIRGGRLYSTTLRLPAQLPLGKYEVDVYLVSNGKVQATDRHSIEVKQVRLEHWVSAVSIHRSWLFGIVFTTAMLLLGLFLGVVLGRGKKV